MQTPARASQRVFALSRCLVLATALAAAIALGLPSCTTPGAPTSASTGASTSVTTTAQRAPRDPSVSQGLLSNGLRYLIAPGQAGGAEVRLVVDAGSLDERDDESGYAHFIEHMAFRKTRRFDDGQIIAFLRGLGANFGQHLNAITGYDRTVYWLGLPRDRTAALPDALRIVADWAGGIEFDEAQIDVERGVVLAEKRGREQQRDLGDDVSRALFEQPLYRRGIVGTDATLLAANAARLRAFRDRHYVPQRMTVILTGQLPEGIAHWRAQIEQEFGRLTASPNAVRATRPAFQIEPRSRIVAVEKGSTHAVAIAALHRAGSDDSIAQLRHDLVARLSNLILNWRIQALARNDSDAVSAAVVDGSPSGDSRLIEFVLSMATPMHQNAINTLVDFMTSWRAAPPSVDELARARDAVLANARRLAVEQSRRLPGALSSRLTDFALRGGYLLSPDQMVIQLTELLPQISADELVQLHEQRLASRDFLITLLSPTGLGKPALSPQQAQQLFDAQIATRMSLAQTLSLPSATTAGVTSGRATTASSITAQAITESAAIAATAVTAATAASAAPVMLATPPPAGAIVEERYIPELAATRLQLANGATVWLAAVNDSNDSMLLRVNRRGGFWSLPPALIAAGRLAQNGVLTEAGIGPLDADQLSRLYSGSSARFSIYVGNERHGMSASATKASTELVLQTLHRFVESARIDQKVLVKNIAYAQQRALADERDPAEQFELDWIRQIRGQSPYFETPTGKDYQQVSIAQLQQVHSLFFGDVSGMHFVFTGSVDVNVLRPLVARYVASLPGSKALPEALPLPSASPIALAIQADALPMERTGVRVERQTNPAQRAFLRVRYFNPAIERTAPNLLMAMHMRRAVAERIRRQLRVKLGIVYSPSVSVDFRDSQAAGLTADLRATVDPDNVQRVEQELQSVIAGLVARPVAADELAALLAAEQDWQSQFGRNSISTSIVLTEIGLNRITPEQFVAVRQQAIQLTAEQLQQAFARAFADVSPSVGVYRPSPSKLSQADWDARSATRFSAR